MKRILIVVSMLVSAETLVLSQPAGQFLADSLTRGLWHFNETTGTEVHDSSFFENHGTAFGTTVVPGKFGDARSFNGSGDYIYIPYSPSFNFDTSSFSVDIWFKTTTTSDGFLVRRGLAPNPGFFIYISKGHLGFEVGNTYGSSWPDTIIRVESEGFFNDNAWHLATLVRDRSARTLSLYADGNLVAPPVDDPILFAISSDRPLTIGCWEVLYEAAYFTGSIDEVRIQCAKSLLKAVGISLNSTTLKFGVVRIPATDSLSLTIRNTGYLDTLHVGSITSSSPVFRPSVEALAIPAGQTGAINVYYRPTTAQQDTATLSIVSDAPNAPIVSVHLSGTGFAPSEKPFIESLTHMPNYYDQASLVWYRSTLDTAGATDPITEYSIWRRVNVSGEQSASTPGGPLWVFLVTVPAVQFEEYSAMVSILYSYPGNPWNVYMVVSHTKSGRFFFSDPDSIQYYAMTYAGASDRGKDPKEFMLHQNYPNPFNPTTTIKYELPWSSNVRLGVYDLLGREVSVLVHERQNAGLHEVRFDGSGLSSGVYFYRLEARDPSTASGLRGNSNGFVQTRKLLLTK